MNKYQPVIGLEVHVELNTKSKMFCRCSADYFGKAANTHTCPICLGLPGALPLINKEAIKSCIKIGLALNCTVNQTTRFERKNYFYPDLPKSYQISQYRWPLCIKGFTEVKNAQGEKRKISINRVHQEEDTGKLSHQNGETLIDFNRSSVPLVEIVTEPDFRDTTEVREYTKKIQQIVRFLGVSNADMEKGDLRLEANVSVRPEGSEELPNYRVELKNINSFKFMSEAIEYEIRRQIDSLEKGEKLSQETRGWDETKKQTYLQRSKEEAHDYRYFPDPDLPEIRIENEIVSIKEEMPELPDAKKSRFVEQYGLNEANAQILTDSRELADYFEKVVLMGIDKQVEAKQIANFIINQKVDINGVEPNKIIDNILNKKVGIIDDTAELEKMAEEAIKDHLEMAEQYKKGKTTVIMALVGVVMKKTQGKANPLKTRELLEKLLNQ